MSLRDKAHENLRAGVRLLEVGDVNAATSRLYYSIFQAAVHALETRHGKKPGQLRANATRWNHAMVVDNAFLLRNNREDRRLIFTMRGLRETADYDPMPVEESHLRDRIEAVASLLEELVDD